MFWWFISEMQFENLSLMCFWQCSNLFWRFWGVISLIILSLFGTKPRNLLAFSEWFRKTGSSYLHWWHWWHLDWVHCSYFDNISQRSLRHPHSTFGYDLHYLFEGQLFCFHLVQIFEQFSSPRRCHTQPSDIVL